ncbi:MAG TPA: hypothetical protein VGY55_17320 [Pirellulales bacterium]|nr:hypothetical protein [Pirellulales bacterium]
MTVSLDVKGELRVATDGKTQKLPILVAGSFAYDEMRLDDCGSADDRRSARFYRAAEAEIQIEKKPDRPSLRDDRRLILVMSKKTGIVISALGGPLTREEVDLLDVPANSLLVDRLLPSAEVRSGETWRPDAAAVGNLLGLDAVARSDVQCVLAAVHGSNVEISISGELNGAVAGVATEIDLKGKGVFDLDHQRLVSIQLRIEERRSAGYVSPAFDVIANVQVEIAPLAGSDQLTSEIVKSIPNDSSAMVPPLVLRSPAGAFQMLYDRRWHVTRDDTSLTVLRLLDRGELVAQCNISPLPQLSAGAEFGLEEFQSDVQQALGKSFGRFDSASEHKTAAGLKLLKVVAEGTVSELPIQWRYYLAIDAEGRRVALTYTLESSLVDRFADADATMVESLELASPAEPDRPHKAHSELRIKLN